MAAVLLAATTRLDIAARYAGHRTSSDTPPRHHPVLETKAGKQSCLHAGGGYGPLRTWYALRTYLASRRNRYGRDRHGLLVIWSRFPRRRTYEVTAARRMACDANPLELVLPKGIATDEE